MIRIFRFVPFICLLFLFNAFGQGAPPIDKLVTPVLTPDRVEAGMFYDGTEVQVTADIPECDGAVVVLETENENIELNEKGRVAGIWLNVAQVTVHNAPKVYIMATSDHLDSICVPEVRHELHLGMHYLRNQMKFESDKTLTGSELDEFVKLKKTNGAYKMDVAMNLVANGTGKKLTAVLPIAPSIPPGTYKLLMYGFTGGYPVCKGEAELTIERVGLALLMANLAKSHAAEYGIIAIVVAMAVGIVMGVIFDSLPGSGH